MFVTEKQNNVDHCLQSKIKVIIIAWFLANPNQIHKLNKKHIILQLIDLD